MIRYFRSILFLSVLVSFACNNEKTKENTDIGPQSEVNFMSSDEELNKAWKWAKTTALSYVRSGDPVGPWYEASLPGRDAFCMRDVSHMSTGAAVLGLNNENINMLYRFAENISESKDYCSYWEINKNNEPAPVDYVYEKDFWYNLPANFDVMDACFRMYLWTGDESYISDPVFTNFYHLSMNEYVDRWNLSSGDIMERERIMNLPEGADPDNHKFYNSRGIPSYHERAGEQMSLGIDLLAVQAAANNWYHYYMSDTVGRSKWLDEANMLTGFIRNYFWEAKARQFNTILYEDGTMKSTAGQGDNFTHSLLHYNAVKHPHLITTILDEYSENKEGYNIEIASHLPDIFFRNERLQDGVQMLKYLTDSTTERRDYPENSFAVVGAFITGLMGITPGAPDNFISTFSRMPVPSSQLLVTSLPIIGKKIDVMHRGRHTSMVYNHSNEAFYWKPYLQGIRDNWYINGKEEQDYGQPLTYNGMEVTAFMIRVEPHSRAIVSAYPPPEK